MNRLYQNLLDNVTTLNENLNLFINQTNSAIDNIIANNYFKTIDANSIYTLKNLAIGDTSIMSNTQFQVIGNTFIDGSNISIGTNTNDSLITIGNISSTVNIYGAVNIQDPSFKVLNGPSIILNQLTTTPGFNMANQGIFFRDNLVDDQGYFLINSNEDGFVLKAPISNGILSIPIGDTDSEVLTSNGGQTINGILSLNAPLNVLDTTDSTSIITGSITTLGGIGISKSLTVGGNLTVLGTATFINTENISIKDNFIMINDNPGVVGLDAGIFTLRYQFENNNGMGDVVNGDYDFSGTISSATTNTCIISGGSNINNFYQYWYIKITNNSPVGVQNQVRKVILYSGIAQLLTLNSNWNVIPDNTTTFALYSQIYIASYYSENNNTFILGGSNFQPTNNFSLTSTSNLRIRNLVLDSTNDSSNLSTGSIVSPGGMAIGKSLYIGSNQYIAGIISSSNTTNAISSTSGSINTLGGLGVSKDFYLGGNLNVNGSSNIQSLISTNLQVNGNANITGTLTLSSSLTIKDLILTDTVDGSSSGGTLNVQSGGAYINKSLYVGNNISINSSLVVGNNASVANLLTTNGLSVTNNASITGNLSVFNNGSIYGIFSSTNSTNSTSITTGAITTQGGLGIGKDTYLGGLLNIVGTITSSNTTDVTGFSLAGGATISKSLTLGTSLVVGTTINVSGNSIMGGTLDITGLITASNSMNLLQALSVGTTLQVSGISTLQGITSITNTTNASAYTNGSFIVSGGMGIAKDVYMNGLLTISLNGGFHNFGLLLNDNVTNSVSITTGSIVTTGGVGIAQDVYIGGSINVATNVVINGDLTVYGTTTVTQEDILINLNNIFILNGDPVIATRDSGIFIQRYQMANDTGLGDIVVNGAPITSNTFSSIIDTSHLVLATADQKINGFYNNMWIKITNNNPPGVMGQVRQITSYTNSGNTIVLTTPLDTLPTNNTTYSIYNKLYAGVYFNETSQDWIFGYSMLQGSLNTVSLLSYNDVKMGNLIINSSTNSTSVSTGSITSPGGMGIVQDVYIGGLLSIGNTLSVQSNANISGNLILSGTLTINSAALTTFNGPIQVNDTTTNSIYSAGGINIQKDSNFGGNIEIGGSISTVDTITSTSDVTVGGKLNVTGNTILTGNLTVNSTTLSTFYGAITIESILDSTNNYSNGSITTLGGIGVKLSMTIGNNLYIGGILDLVGQLNISNTTNSTSITTGSINTLGGLGVSLDMYLGGNLNIIGNIATVTKITTTSDTLIGGKLNVTGNSTLTGKLTVNSVSQSSFSGPLLISDTTNSTTVSTGSLITYGGLGVALNTFIGGTLNIAGIGTFTSNIIINNTNNSTTLSGNSIYTLGGLGVTLDTSIGGQLTITKQLFVNSTTDSTSYSTGSVVIAGGLGIAKNMYINGNSNITGTLTVTNTAQFNNTTTSSSYSTGSVVIAGGLGIEDNLYTKNGINSGGNLTLSKNLLFSNGTNSITLQLGTLTVSTTYTLPINYPTSNNNVLTIATSGGGIMSWSGPYQPLNSNLTYLSGITTQGFVVYDTTGTLMTTITMSSLSTSLTMTNGNGSGNLTLQLAQEILTTSNVTFNNLTINGTTLLNSATTIGAATENGTINIGSLSNNPRNINIGTSSSANILTIGSTASSITSNANAYSIASTTYSLITTSTLVLDSGASNISIGTNTTGNLILGSTTNTAITDLYGKVVNISSNNNLNINSLIAANSINIGNNAIASTINMGNDNSARNINIGYAISQVTNSINLNALTVNLTFGLSNSGGLFMSGAGPVIIDTTDVTGGIAIGVTSNSTITIGPLDNSGLTTITNNSIIQGSLTVYGTTVYKGGVETDNPIFIDNVNATGNNGMGYLSMRWQEDTGTTIGAVINSQIADSGTVISATTTSIRLSKTQVDGYYNNWWILITSGATMGQARKIVSYVSSTQIASLDSAWSTPAVSSTYNLYNQNYTGYIYDEVNSRFYFGYYTQPLTSGSSANYLNSVGLIHAQSMILDNNLTIALTSGYQLQLQNGSKAISSGWATYSSRKNKDNINNINDDVINKINNINAKTYNLINNNNKEYGFIAEEMNDVIPEIVDKDIEGNPIGIQYNGIIPLLVEYVKKLEKRIKILEQY